MGQYHQEHFTYLVQGNFSVQPGDQPTTPLLPKPNQTASKTKNETENKCTSEQKFGLDGRQTIVYPIRRQQLSRCELWRFLFRCNDGPGTVMFWEKHQPGDNR